MNGGVLNLDFLEDDREVYKDKISKAVSYHRLFTVS